MSTSTEDQKAAERAVGKAQANVWAAYEREGLQLGKKLSRVSVRHGGTLTEEELSAGMQAFLERCLYVTAGPVAVEAPERVYLIVAGAVGNYQEATAQRTRQKAMEAGIRADIEHEQSQQQE